MGSVDDDDDGRLLNCMYAKPLKGGGQRAIYITCMSYILLLYS